MSKGHLSESATKKLVNLLIERGYFHQDIDPQLADPDQKLSDICAFSETDVACQLVTTKDDTVMTRDQLKTCLMDQLALVGGRMSVQDATVALGVDAQHIEYVSNELIRVGNDLITEDYLDTMGERTNLELTKQDGHVVISELASNVWNMPMELTLSALEERIASEIITARILGLLGMKVLVTPDFEEREKCRIRGAFQAITLPTHVSSFAAPSWIYGYFSYAPCLHKHSALYLHRSILCVMSFIGIATTLYQSCKAYAIEGTLLVRFMLRKTRA